MNNILIIALSEEVKLEYINKFIHVKLRESPHLNFSILTNQPYANELYSNTYTLDHQNIKKLSKSKIFNTGYALNLLFDELYEVSKKNWNYIYNFSDDRLSLYISSFVASKNNTKILGISMDRNSKCYSSLWSSFLDSQINTKVKHYFNYSSLLIDITKKESDQDCKNEKHYFDLFLGIKKELSDDQHKKVNLVGIFINETSLGNNQSLHELNQVVQDLLCNSSYYPVLIYPSFLTKSYLKKNIKDSFLKYLIKISYTPKSIEYINKNLDIIVNKTSTPFSYVLDTNTLLIEFNKYKNIISLISKSSSEKSICSREDIEKKQFILSIFKSAFDDIEVLNICKLYNPLLKEWARIQADSLEVKQKELTKFKMANSPEDKARFLQHLLHSDNNELQDIIVFIFNAKVNNVPKRQIDINYITSRLLTLISKINSELKLLNKKACPQNIIKKGEYEQRI
ncbi:MAG: hypothetical protein HOJ35_04955 [Bdellovibrionales bacterium]|nr:hypothetical protein [Bdellovibrionales bacterium]